MSRGPFIYKKKSRSQLWERLGIRGLGSCDNYVFVVT